jgi:hypothetical protein
MDAMPDARTDVTAHAVVVRRGDVDLRYPWPHYVGTWPSEEGRPRSDDAPDHPFRTGEFFRRIRLVADMSLLDVGTVMATLCDNNQVSPSQCALFPIARLVDKSKRLGEDAWILTGGIDVYLGGEHVVGPQCCCGIETWREWERFVDGGDAPWCGHSPDAVFHRLESGALELGYVDAKMAIVSPGALRAALSQVEQDLEGFVTLVARWADEVVPRLASPFVATFAKMLGMRGPRAGDGLESA